MSHGNSDSPDTALPAQLYVIVDGRKEKIEQRCLLCGSNETYKDQSEYLQTLDKKA